MKDAAAKEVGRLIASQCLAVRVRRLERVISRIYDAALAEHGINIAQLNLLAAIAAGDQGRPSDLPCAVFLHFTSGAALIGGKRAPAHWE